MRMRKLMKVSEAVFIKKAARQSGQRMSVWGGIITLPPANATRGCHQGFRLR